jgi:antitoxin component of MazEF toxin-antitoxin module
VWFAVFQLAVNGGARMALTRKITRIGNSKGIILPQPVLDQLHWDSDAELELQIHGKSLVLVPLEYATDTQVATIARKVFTGRRRLMKRLAR